MKNPRWHPRWLPQSFCGNFAETIMYTAIIDVNAYIFVVKESIYTMGLIVLDGYIVKLKMVSRIATIFYLG